MSRSFRNSDQFADKRAAFADRKEGREARIAEFRALGYDDPEAFADLPIYGDARRERVRRAWRA